MTTSQPVVAVWKASWLPPSQTFVKNQLDALERWRPLLLGVRRVEGLPVTPDLAPFGSGVGGRVAHRLSAAVGYRGVYDRLIRSSQARLVHAHFGTSAVQVLPVARRLGLPLMATFHGFDVTREPERPGRAGATYRRRLADVFDYADVLLVNSEFLAGRLLALGAPEKKVRVHRIGIPVDGVPEPGPGAPTSRDGVVFVGRLVEVKGVTDLLTAVGRLRAEGREVTLRVVGDGPLAPALRRQAKELGVAAELLGRRTPAEVAAILRESAVFCAPSRTSADGQAEAFGMVFLEAALHGLPVVAYRHGGVPEAVEDGVTSLLAPEGDVETLAQNLALLLDQPERARALGAAGRERVLREFDVRGCTAELESIYDEVAARGRTSGRGPE